MEYRVFCTLYLMLSTYLLGAQSESEIRECAFDVLQPFLAQSFDRKEVVLALPHEPADGPDGRIVESILDALRKTELRDAGLQDFGVAVDDTHVLDFVIHASYRGKDGVESDGPDVHALLLMRLFGDVPQAALRAQFELERDFADQFGDVVLGIQYLDLSGDMQVGGSERLRAFCGERYGLRLVGQYLQAYPADIEQYRHDIFTHTFNS